MPRKLSALIATLCILGNVLIATLAATGAQANYYNSCDQNVPSGTFSPTWHIWRTSTSVGFSDMTATAIVQKLEACPNPPSGHTGSSMVLPVNLQDNYGGPFVQLGWGELAQGQGMDWLYTNSPSSGGVVVRDGGQLPPSAVIGEEVRFRIRKDSIDGQPFWKFNVTVLTGPYAGVDAFKTWVARTNGASADQIWAGIEVKNWQSQFGGAGHTKKVVIFDIGYQFAPGGSWYWMTSPCESATDWANTRGQSAPYYYEARSVSGYSGNEITGCAIKGWTVDHY